MSARRRLDVRVVDDGLASSREVARRLVMAGQVRVDGQVRDKPGMTVPDDALVEVTAQPRFVSRGGEKLQHALDDLGSALDRLGRTIDGARAMDVGASTGGFTDCLLQAGAAGVIAVDVGYGQLDARLRSDERVTVLERTNARHLTPQMLPWQPELLVCDASFISLATVLEAPAACMAPGWWGLILCKPQFEAGPSRVGRGGVIRDDDVRAEVLDETIARVSERIAPVHEVVEARPRGRKGNVEYVLLVGW